MIFGYYRKYIPCEIPGIFTLVYVDKYFLDEGSFHFSRSG